jgi:hypothetical protein
MLKKTNVFKKCHGLQLIHGFHFTKDEAWRLPGWAMNRSVDSRTMTSQTIRTLKVAVKVIQGLKVSFYQ